MTRGPGVAQQAADELGAVFKVRGPGDAGLRDFQVRAHLAERLDVGRQALLVGLHPGGAFGQLAGEAERGVAGLASLRQGLRIELGAGRRHVSLRRGLMLMSLRGGTPGRFKLRRSRVELPGHDFVLKEAGVRLGVVVEGRSRVGQGFQVVAKGL